MPEWSIGAVSKTVERFAFQGFESLSLREEKGKLRLAFFHLLEIFTRLKSSRFVGLLPMSFTRLLTKRSTSS